MIVEKLKRKKIGIIGLGKTGYAIILALFKSNIDFVCYDDKEEARNNFLSKATEIVGEDVLRDYSDPKWQECDYIIASPGVPLFLPVPHPIVKLYPKIPIISDLDLYFICEPDKKYIGITGTNGKSTTTYLINHILKNNNINSECAGNIGVSPFETLDPETLVLELSSYQLDLITNLKLDISIILNITPDHLERYGSFEKYIESKAKIVSLGRSDSYAIINIDDPICEKILRNLPGNVIPISTKKILKNSISLIDNKIYDSFNNRNSVYKLPNLPNLTGNHNLENILAAYASARIYNIDTENILKSLQTFVNLPHRMQFIKKYKNITFINDSKATNDVASRGAIEYFNNIYWLAGGLSKEEGITSLMSLKTHIKKAFLFGKAKEEFANVIATNFPYEKFENLEEALKVAFKSALKAKEEIVILLSPSCSSLDQFKNFEERGNKFIEIIHNLTENN